MKSLLFLIAFAIHERKDLSDASAYFCNPSPSVQVKDKPIPDAQIERAFVTSDRSLNEVAKDFAKENSHRGYASGKCSDGRKFVVSVPAPKPIIDKKDLKLDHETLKKCQRFELNAILKNQDQPVILDWKKFDRKQIAVLSVTCFPKDKKDAGPELWALIAEEDQPVPNIENQAAFFSWINEIRKKNSLSPLSPEDKLSELAKRAGTESLQHPHQFLIKAKAELAQQKIEVLGENRAISSDFTGLARLFWNSPQHRSLLLNAKANAIGYAIKESKDQKTIVLILGKI